LCHCGTGNAGDGSKHLADATATLVASRLSNILAMMKRIRECKVVDTVEVYSDQCCLAGFCRLHEAEINPSSDELAFARAHQSASASRKMLPIMIIKSDVKVISANRIGI
jgi:hypothetical protein